MKLLKFNQYITEAREIEPHEEAELLKMGETSTKLTRLVKLGLIDQSGYSQEISAMAKAFNKFIKGLNLDLKDQADLDLLKLLGQKAGQASILGLDTLGAKALFAKGLHMVSSPTQLANGSLIFSVDPEYRRKDGWGIGFFPGPKAIRRMTPKQINIGIGSRRGGLGSMDINIKYFKDIIPSLDFYNKAMLWASENIDFEHAVLYPEKHVWKYHVKKKGAPAKRTEADDLRVQAKTLAAELRLSPYNSNSPERLASLEKYAESWKLRLKAARLDDNQREIFDALERISNIELEIARLTKSNYNG